MTTDLNDYQGMLIEVTEIQGETLTDGFANPQPMPTILFRSGRSRWRSLLGHEFLHCSGDVATAEITGWTPVSAHVHAPSWEGDFNDGHFYHYQDHDALSDGVKQAIQRIHDAQRRGDDS